MYLKVKRTIIKEYKSLKIEIKAGSEVLLISENSPALIVEYNSQRFPISIDDVLKDGEQIEIEPEPIKIIKKKKR